MYKIYDNENYSPFLDGILSQLDIGLTENCLDMKELKLYMRN